MHSGVTSASSGAPWKKGERMALAGTLIYGVPNLMVFLLILVFMMVPIVLNVDWLPAPDTSSVQSQDNTLMDVLFAGLCLLWAVDHIGLAMILWALFVAKLRVRWFYYVMQVATVLMLFSAGSILLALVVSRYLHSTRGEFVTRNGVPPCSTAPVPPIYNAEPPLLKARRSVAQRDDIVLENERLKQIVAAQSLEIHRLKEGVLGEQS